MAQNGALSEKQARAIAALLSEKTHQGAARAAGIGRRTLTRWLADPVFKAALMRAQGELLSSSLVRIGRLVEKSLDTLEALQDSPDPAIKLRAASQVLAIAADIHELIHLENRLDDLERMV